MDDDLGFAAEDFGADFGEALTNIAASTARAAWRDALALIAACWDNEQQRAEMVMCLMDEPQLTAAQLASIIAKMTSGAGMPREELAEQQRQAALGE